MTGQTVIRPAREDEIEPLSQLCRRSKAHWGYDARFMELSRNSLTVRRQWVTAGNVLVAERDGVAAGVAAIAPDGPGHEVALFFVDPAFMGHGIGADLYRAMIALAAERGIARLGVLADPNAASFYEKMGARPVGSEPSESIPGRFLPYLEVDVPRR